jgi:hypothetical protein
VLARPWTERNFTYRAYDRLLERLADGFNVVPLREFADAPTDKPVVALRHDVDARLGSAIEMAELEHARGIRATYFVLHTAPYYSRIRGGVPRRTRTLLRRLQRLKDLGHEIGFHNDLVTLQCVFAVEPRSYLAQELEWLRGHGFDVRGSASHGSYWAHKLGYHNNYFFSDFDEVHAGFENKEVVQVGSRREVLSQGSLAEFGLEYEAYHLGEDRYYSDGRFDDEGRRFHTDLIDVETMRPGERAIVLTHPESWDPSFPRKVVRTAIWAPRRLFAERSWKPV